jgi:hypothetical protein
MRGVYQTLDGRAQVTFSSASNRFYRLEASVDLATWETVEDLIPGVQGDLTVTDTRYVPGADGILYRVLVY